MIKVNKGDLLNVDSGIIVHGVNSLGVMGSGVALAVKQKYPGAYKAYTTQHNTYELFLGDVIWYKHHNADLFIANAITQEKYGRDGKRYVNYAAVVECFNEVIRVARMYDMPIHFPYIGAGLGGGDWNIISNLINDCDPEDKVSKNLWVL